MLKPSLITLLSFAATTAMADPQRFFSMNPQELALYNRSELSCRDRGGEIVKKDGTVCNLGHRSYTVDMSITDDQITQSGVVSDVPERAPEVEEAPEPIRREEPVGTIAPFTTDPEEEGIYR